MLTWLNYFYKQTLPLVDVKWHGGDPRKALAFYVGRCILDAQRRIAPFEDALDEAFHVMLMPFLQVFLPAGATWKTTNGIEVSRPLGLLLRHSTANLLIERGGSKYPRCNVAVSPWRRSRCVR